MRVRIAGLVAAACCLGGALVTAAQPATPHAPEPLKVILSVVNATESAHTFDLSLTGSRLATAAKLSELMGSSVDAINHAGQAPQIKVKEVQLSGTPGTISVAPISVNIYRFPLTQ